MKKFLYIAAMTLLLAGCSEDYKDWAEPQSNPQGAEITFGTGAASEVGLIDYALLPAGTESVKVCNLTNPGSSDTTYYAVHDGARPAVPVALIRDCVASARKFGSGVAAAARAACRASHSARSRASRSGPGSRSSISGIAMSGASAYWGSSRSSVRRRVIPAAVSSPARARMASMHGTA